MAVPLALAIPLVIYLTATLIHRPPKIQLRAERSVGTDTVPQNKPVKVMVKITNDGADLDEVMIEDHLPQGWIWWKARRSVLTSLPRGASVELHYTVRAARGSYTFADVQISASDHLGVLREQAVLTAPGANCLPARNYPPAQGGHPPAAHPRSFWPDPFPPGGLGDRFLRAARVPDGRPAPLDQLAGQRAP